MQAADLRKRGRGMDERVMSLDETESRAVRRARSAELEDLALGARDGVPGSFEELVRRLTPRVIGFAGGILRDRGLAEEAAQETFVRLYRFLPTYRSESFIAWCLAIAHNVCRDLMRREQRASRAATVEPDRVPDPMEAADVRRAVEEALDRLPDVLRSTFLLHQQGLTYRDVSVILDRPIGTIRSRLHEARRQLRRYLIHVIRPGEES